MKLLAKNCRDLDSLELITAEIAKERGLTEQIDEGWIIDPARNILSRQFEFSGFEEIMLFVNFVGWISAQHDHHPRTTFEYKNCTIEYHTHSISGLSIKDFICAAHIDSFLKDSSSS